MLTREYLQQIQERMIDLFETTNKKEGACLYMAALLCAVIQDNLPVTPKFVTGSLTLKKRLVFSHEPIRPVLISGHDFSGRWDGHSWVEVEDYIFDPSIFWTIYSQSTPQDLQTEFENTFNGKYSFLIGSRTELEKLGVVYKVYEELSNDDISILINSGCVAGFFDKSIC
ncbi:hypothetical protein PJ305_004401 [Salmonella enterica]|nr:hypothetical protein [Salmonella enterica]EDV0942076.1 hypothetical protein [Salmonella enterica subsp. enterica serovar Pomona]EBU1155463.1 hypothetical protein [Salmonella enterica]EJD3003034.1 hypothetical protein [Salmonella enterica]EKJ9760374.1 hypothetical protein [Salmonella enterica]